MKWKKGGAAVLVTQWKHETEDAVVTSIGKKYVVVNGSVSGSKRFFFDGSHEKWAHRLYTVEEWKERNEKIAAHEELQKLGVTLSSMCKRDPRDVLSAIVLYAPERVPP